MLAGRLTLNLDGLPSGRGTRLNSFCWNVYRALLASASVVGLKQSHHFHLLEDKYLLHRFFFLIEYQSMELATVGLLFVNAAISIFFLKDTKDFELVLWTSH